MQRWLMAILFFGACAFGLIVMVVTAAQDKPEGGHEAEGPTMPAVTLDAAAAQAIYKQSCAACHGDQFEGKVGPSLKTIGTKMSVEQIYKIVLNGKGNMMPSFKQLGEEQVANLAQWLAQNK